jgi:hypothetical protein
MNYLVLVFGCFVVALGVFVFVFHSDISFPVNVSSNASQSVLPSGVSDYVGSYPAVVSPIISNVVLNVSNGSLNLAWNVVGGVGCCNSFNCDYVAFRDACLTPFRLYNLYFDDVLVNISTDKNWLYTCTDVTPYNTRYWNSVSVGKHSVTIDERGCSDSILASETLNFIVSNNSVRVI